MRRLLLLALLPLACSRERGSPESSGASGAPPQAADQLVLRVPRFGGSGRVYTYPRLDSVIWTSSGLPAINRVLGFDGEAGAIAFVDAKGRPVRLDLRLNEARVATRARLSSVTSGDGSDIYGVAPNGDVLRLDANGGTWTLRSKTPPRSLLAEPDGSVILAYAGRDSTLLALVRPPDTAVAARAKLPLISRAVRTQLGDRVYFTSDSGLVGVRAKNLSVLRPIRFQSRVHALAPTPSGDRLYVVTVTEPVISVVDRYSDRIVARISLPATPADLRMDPLGRYLLASYPSADSAWVIPIGGGRPTGSVATRWTADLPSVAPDGDLALLGPRDVTFADGETLKTTRVIPGGAKDFWYFFTWDGFRPRAQGVDEPVSFNTNDSGAASSTTSAAASTTPPVLAPKRDSGRIAPAPAKGFVVSFAAVLDEARAKSLAAQISVNGAAARVVPVTHGSTTVYRVLLGPFATRDEAERIGKVSGRSYWIYEGNS